VLHAKQRSDNVGLIQRLGGRSKRLSERWRDRYSIGHERVRERLQVRAYKGVAKSERLLDGL
jgi:hypothetical protein